MLALASERETAARRERVDFRRSRKMPGVIVGELSASVAQHLLPLAEPSLLIRYGQCVQVVWRCKLIVHPFAQ
jgi:hypothetical protein